MEDKRYLTFALGKGRLAKTTLSLFEKIGITCEETVDKKTGEVKSQIKLEPSAQLFIIENLEEIVSST